MTKNEPAGKGWALRLVAQWCENRCKQIEDRRLIERGLRAYKNGPLVGPVARFVHALSEEVDHKTEYWANLALEMRREADELEKDTIAASVAASPEKLRQTAEFMDRCKRENGLI